MSGKHEPHKFLSAASAACGSVPAGQKSAGRSAGKSAKGKVDRKTMLCFKMCDSGNCFDDDKCEYPHKKSIIDVDKENKKNGGVGQDQEKKSGYFQVKAKHFCHDCKTPGKEGLRESSCEFLDE